MNDVSKELEKLTIFTGKYTDCEDFMYHSDPCSGDFYFIVTDVKAKDDVCSLIKMQGRQDYFFQFLACVSDIDLPYVILKVQV